MMKNILESIKENYSQALQFGGWGALGGAIGSLLAELISWDNSTSFVEIVISVGIWFGVIGGLISIFLLMGYSSYLKRGWRIGESTKKGILPGLLAGFIAGAIAQSTYTIIGPTELLRVICWGIAGGLLGLGLSFRIPNLGKIRGLSGGGIGGIIGGILFIFISFVLGEVMGRLLGISAIGFFIGVMIILVEAAFRQAWLVVKWSANEQKTLSLGSDPILLGCADKAHIYLRQDQGYAPITAKVYVDKNKIFMQYESEYGEKKGMKKLTHELENGDKRKLGSVSLEVKTAKS
jgi:Ca-activated chloride channel family protein